MSRDENEFRVRPGRIKDAGKSAGRRATKLGAQVKQAANRAGYTRSRSYGGKAGGRSSRSGRGRHALAAMRRTHSNRRVTVMARIVRHKGAQFRSAPLARHISYLERDGVTRDGKDASMFDARGDEADRNAFAERCEDDRHHFRFIVSPEDAGELSDLRVFTRELMADMAKDLDTRLDWIAVDHWNTYNPHIHILMRGVADDGTDLVIDRGYVSEGIRCRAEQLVTLELGPRSEQQIQSALEREVEAERWTSLDKALERLSEEGGGLIDLRPDPETDTPMQNLLRGRAAALENMGLAKRLSSGIWVMESDAQATLQEIASRDDIIKTMHRAMGNDRRLSDSASLVLHNAAEGRAVTGRLVERGLDDELAGSAYAIIDGTDGRIHHLRFDDLEMTGDGAKGSIVELRSWEDNEGKLRLSLATRSDLPIDAQVTAPGATWLDRQLIAKESITAATGFGADVRNALEARAQFLEGKKLAGIVNGRWSFASRMIEALRSEELADAVQKLSDRTGLEHRPAEAGKAITGRYRERVTLSSGRFAMIDDGLGFQLVPWRPALEKHLGQEVTGTMSPSGSVAWAPGRTKGIGL